MQYVSNTLVLDEKSWSSENKQTNDKNQTGTSAWIQYQIPSPVSLSFMSLYSTSRECMDKDRVQTRKRLYPPLRRHAQTQRRCSLIVQTLFEVRLEASGKGNRCRSTCLRVPAVVLAVESVHSLPVSSHRMLSTNQYTDMLMYVFICRCSFGRVLV